MAVAALYANVFEDMRENPTQISRESQEEPLGSSFSAKVSTEGKDWEFISYDPEDLQRTARVVGSLGLKHGYENVHVVMEPPAVIDTARVYYPKSE